MSEPPAKKAKTEDESIAPAQSEKTLLPNAANEDKWYPDSVTSIKDKFSFKSTTHHTKIPAQIATSPEEPVILGVDEAGRGPVIGPMVYGIAYCLESYQEKLKTTYGFMDSKVLKEHVRLDLFEKMHHSCPDLRDNVGWATRTMTAKDISEGMLRSTLGAGSYNLNEQAHDTTIQLIKEVLQLGVNVKKIFVDTVGPPASYQAKLLRAFPGIEVTVAKKADSIYPIVSTASVAAKVTRDKNLEWFNKNYEPLIGQNIGSGYPSDPNTSRWLNANVDTVFGWSPGLIRFLWQTAKDSLEKNGGVAVTYEDECVNEKGYKDILEMFLGKSDVLVDKLFYGKTLEL